MASNWNMSRGYRKEGISRGGEYDLAPAESAPAQSDVPPQPVAGPATPGQGVPRSTRLPTDSGPERKCPHCGFSYHGTPKARCPDCGAHLDSGSEDLLKFAPGSWVRSVATGLTLITLSIPLHVVGSVFRWIAVYGAPSAHPIKAMFHLAAAIVLLMGVFNVTRKDSTAKDAAGPRMVARGAAVVAAAFWLMLLLLALKTPDSSIGIVKVLLEPALLSQAVLAVALGFHVRNLASRVPDDGLASHVDFNAGLCALVCGLCMVLWYLELLTPDNFRFFMFSFPIILAFLVILSWAMVTLLRLGANLRACAAEGDLIVAKRMERMTARSA